MSDQLKCPACGSDDISALAANALRCRHCGTSFAAPGAPTGPVHVHVHAAPPAPPSNYAPRPAAYVQAPAQAPQVVYLPAAPKRKTSIVTWAVLGCILFCFGLGIVRLIQVKMQEAERAEAQRVAAIEAGEKVAKALEAAKAQYAAGELEKAVKTLEAIVDDATYLQAENRIEAVKLHEQYGKEYGKRFEAKAAENLAKAREFVKAHKADDALKELDAAIALRYAPQMDELNALRAALLSACDERKMRQIVEAMSDAEFEAFRLDLTLPDRRFFDDADINAIFVDRLKLRHAEAVKWREDAKAREEAARRAAVEARDANWNGKIAKLKDAAKSYTGEGFKVVSERSRVVTVEKTGETQQVLWRGRAVKAAVLELRNERNMLVQRDRLIYFVSEGNKDGVNSWASDVFAYDSLSFPQNSTLNTKRWVIGDPYMGVIVPNKLLDRLRTAEKSMLVEFDEGLKAGGKPALTRDFSDGGWKAELKVEWALGIAQISLKMLPEGFPSDWNVETVK